MGTPAVVLRQPESGATAVVGIGLGEAPGIAAYVHGVALEQPLAGDVIRELLSHCDAHIVRVEILKTGDGEYRAALRVQTSSTSTPGSNVSISCRVSDAICVALCCESPVWVDRTLQGAIDPAALTPFPDYSSSANLNESIHLKPS